jgi:carbon-monoxide dehydrogenase small subunit
VKVTVTVNGRQVAAEVPDRTLLVHFVREQAGLTATNVGCDTSSCGACTVLLDGRSVKSCTLLAAQADGRDVLTVEGLRTGHEPAASTGDTTEDAALAHPVQRAFRAEHALQCGFCTPGMVMAAVSLLAENPDPTEDEVRTGLKATCAGAPRIATSSGRCSPRR